MLIDKYKLAREIVEEYDIEGLIENEIEMLVDHWEKNPKEFKDVLIERELNESVIEQIDKQFVENMIGDDLELDELIAIRDIINNLVKEKQNE